jgi:hypothetical protein
VPLNLDAMLLQPANSGGFNATSGNATLANGTTAGSTVLLAVAWGGVGPTVPSGFVRVTASTQGGSTTVPSQLYARSNVPAGETSWAITASSTVPVAWWVAEVQNLDPAALLDAGPTGPVQASASSTTTATSSTTDRSTTYDGMVVALFAGYQSASTTPVTWSGHTSGYAELADIGQAGASTSVGLSVAVQFTQQLSTFAASATASATASTVSAYIAVLTAADAKKEPNIAFFWGFKVGAGAAGLSTGNAFFRYLDNVVAGTPAMTAAGLQLTGTASAQQISALIQTLSASVRAAVAQVRFRFDTSLPSGDLEVAKLGATGVSGDAVLRYVTASQKLGLKIGTGTEQLSDATVTANSFVTVDLRLIGTTTAFQADWQIDYGSGPVVQTQATFTASGVLAQYAGYLGWSAAATGTVTYAHALYSNVAGHYPLGPHTIVLLTPSGTPTVSGTVGNFAFITANATGTALAAGTLANVPATIDDFPPTVGGSADGVCATAASATDYIEIPMATYDASGTGSIRAARVVVPMWAASATAATCRVIGYDGTTATTLFFEADPQADNTSTPAWICAMWRPTGGWTQAKLDAAAIRFGSNDATPDIGPLAVGMEVAVQNGAVAPIIGESGSVEVTEARDPVSGGMLAVTVDTPADQGTTLFWDDAGTPGSQVVAPSSSHTETFDAPDATTVVEVGVISDNEDPDRE